MKEREHSCVCFWCCSGRHSHLSCLECGEARSRDCGANTQTFAPYSGVSVSFEVRTWGGGSVCVNMFSCCLHCLLCLSPFPALWHCRAVCTGTVYQDWPAVCCCCHSLPVRCVWCMKPTKCFLSLSFSPEFFAELSRVTSALALTSSLTDLVHYIRQGLQWLRLEANMP